MNSFLHIGIDDTDSMRKGCTTYVAALLVERLSHLGFNFIDYPNIIRLNPNVPWKTRGNGALCLRISGAEDFEEVRKAVIEVVEDESDLESRGTDPGIVFYEGKEIPAEFREFSRKAIQEVVSLREALALIREFKASAVGFKNGRGIIGALAAVGSDLKGDYTYELLTYRTPINRGKPRMVDPNSVFRMDKETRGSTFNNVDWEKRRILITPRGPDPVLYGIRGESPEAVKRAHEMIVVNEDVERWVIFRTNQGTDAHLSRVKKISGIRPFRPIIALGTIASKPRTIPGGHVIFTIEDDTGKIDCAAYEPTGKFREIVRRLVKGDTVEVYGGVRAPSSGCPITINLEKMRIIKLVPKIVYQSPLCPNCGKRMTSMGRGKGYRCDRCHYRDPRAQKVKVEVKRDLLPGIYIPPPRAHRHLTKPLSRYGKEKHGFRGISFKPWHNP